MIVILLDKWIYPASCMGPFIFIRKADYNITLLNHEYIHFKQQLETLFIGAYFIYMIELLIKLVYYRNIKTAYLSLSFEREAYLFQHVVGYANGRKHYNWVRYIWVSKNTPLKK